MSDIRLIIKSEIANIRGISKQTKSLNGLRDSARDVREEMQLLQDVMRQGFPKSPLGDLKSSAGKDTEAISKLAKSVDVLAGNLRGLRPPLNDTRTEAEKLKLAADRVRRSLETPMERATKQLREVERLYKKGAVSADTMRRAQERFNKSSKMAGGKSVRSLADAFGMLPGPIGNATSSLQSFAGLGLTPATVGVVGLGAAMLGVGAIIMKGLGQFRTFETGLVSVAKVAGLTGLEMARFGDSIDELARGPEKLGQTSEELLAIAAGAAQIGVKGSKNLQLFTETMARLALSTDVVGDEGTRQFGKFLSITNSSTSEVDNLGSSLVKLGNNYATTESAIVETALKVAQGGASFGLAADDALAYAATLDSLGVPAELARSTLLRLGQTIKTASIEGGADLERLASIAGVSSAQLKDALEKDAGDAISMLLKGFRRIDENKGNVVAALDSVGLSGIRLGAVIPTLAGNVEKLDRAMAMSAAEAANPSALLEESRRASETLDATIKRSSESWSSLLRIVGEEFAPQAKAALNDVSDSLEGMRIPLANAAHFWANVTDEIYKTAKAAGVLSAALLRINGGIDIINGLAGSIDAAVAPSREFHSSLQDLADLASSDDIGAVNQGVLDAGEAFAKASDDVAKAQFLVDKYSDSLSVAVESGQDIGDINKQLNKAKSGLSKAKKAADEYDNVLSDLKNSQMLLTLELGATTDELSAEERALKSAGKALSDSLLTAQERAARHLGEAVTLYNASAIGIETMTRALQRYAEVASSVKPPNLGDISGLSDIKEVFQGDQSISTGLTEIPVDGAGQQASMTVVGQTNVAAEAAYKMADGFALAADEAWRISEGMEGSTKSAFQLLGFGADLGVNFAELAAAKKSGDEQAIKGASEQLGSAVEGAVISVIQHVAGGLSGGGTSQFGGAKKRNFAAEGAQLGGQVAGPVGAFAGLVVGGLIEESAEKAIFAIGEAGDAAAVTIKKADKGLKPFANQFAQVLENFFQSLELIVGDLNLEGLDGSIKIEGDLVTVRIQGLVKGFEDANQALGFFLEKLLQFNEGIAEEGTNLGGLLRRLGGRAEIGGFEELQEAIDLAVTLDSLNIGIDPAHAAAVRQTRAENERMMEVARAYGLVLSDVVKLTNARIEAEIRGVRMQKAAFVGVTDFFSQIEGIAGPMGAVNTELERESLARAERIRLIQEELASIEGATESVEGAVANLTDGVVGGMESATQEATQAGQQAAGSLIGGFKEGLGGGETPGEDLNKAIPGMPGNLQEFREETGDLLHEVGQGVQNVATLREELEALLDEANELPEAIDLQEIVEVWTAGASKAGMQVIDILRRLRGEGAFAEQERTLQTALYLIQLKEVTRGLEEMLAEGDLAGTGLRGLFEGLLDELNQAQEDVAKDGLPAVNAASGQRKQIRESVMATFRDLRLATEHGSDAVASFANELDTFLDVIADAAKVGIDATQAWEDFTAQQGASILEPFSDALADSAGMSEFQKDLKDITDAREEALAQLNLLRDTLIANGQSVEELAGRYEELDAATQQQIKTLGEDFLGSLADMGASLPVEVTYAMARASFIATKAALLRTAADLEAAGAFEELAEDISIVEDAIRGLSFESIAFAEAMDLGARSSSSFRQQLDEGMASFDRAREELAAGGPAPLRERQLGGAERRFLQSMFKEITKSAQDFIDAGKGIGSVGRQVRDTVDAATSQMADLKALRKEYQEAGRDTAELDAEMDNLQEGLAITIDQIAIDFTRSLDKLGVSLSPEQTEQLARLEFQLAKARALDAIATLQANNALESIDFDWVGFTESVMNAEFSMDGLTDGVNDLGAAAGSTTMQILEAQKEITEQARAFIQSVIGEAGGELTAKAMALNDEIDDLRSKKRFIDPAVYEQFEEVIPQAFRNLVNEAFDAIDPQNVPEIQRRLESLAALKADALEAFAAIDVDQSVIDDFSSTLEQAATDSFRNAVDELAGISEDIDPLKEFRDSALELLAIGAEFGQDISQAAVDLQGRLDELKAAAIAPITGILDALSPGGQLSGGPDVASFAAAQENFNALLAGGVTTQEDAEAIAEAFNRFLGQGGVAESFLGADDQLLAELRRQAELQLQAIADTAFQDITLDNAAAQLQTLQANGGMLAQQLQQAEDQRIAMELAAQEASRVAAEEATHRAFMAMHAEQSERTASSQRGLMVAEQRTMVRASEDLAAALDLSNANLRDMSQRLNDIGTEIALIRLTVDDLEAANTESQRSGMRS
jgi:TP901 family phage tail tape measure protein